MTFTNKGFVVAEETDYYPFGEILSKTRDPNAPFYRYGYQGEYSEEDEETGWNQFELRLYDGVVGRWLSVDPMGQYWSPFVGMGNNPVNGVDPDGGSNKPFIPHKDPNTLWKRLINSITGNGYLNQAYRQKQDGLSENQKIVYYEDGAALIWYDTYLNVDNETGEVQATLVPFVKEIWGKSTNWAEILFYDPKTDLPFSPVGLAYSPTKVKNVVKIMLG